MPPQPQIGRIALVSLALLAPCFWHSTIQAGDLSSHLYNAWLAQLIEEGKAPGLAIATQSTNVLFDLALGWLMGAFGPRAAERIAVAGCVLLFFWGAFYLASKVNRRAPWALAPCLAMLAYGWTFHMGFFNFYLAAGLCLWALALMWDAGLWKAIAAAALIATAYVAHSLAAGWALGVIAYAVAYRKTPERLRIPLLGAALAAVLGLRFFVMARYNTFWSPHQVLEVAAIDQVWVFGLKYLMVSIALGMLWSFLFLRYSHPMSMSQLVSGLPYQICALTCAGVLLIPTRIELHGYNAALSFITERMTLLSGAAICVLLGAAKPERWQSWSLAAVAAVYFSFVYVDTRDLSALENKLEAALAEAPNGSRVFSSFTGADSRVPLWPHAVDRPCIGRCFSYANYEPPSAAFRVRVAGENGLVVSSPDDSHKMANGGYVVKQRDEPLYQLAACEGSGICVHPLKAGQTTEAYPTSFFRLLW